MALPRSLFPVLAALALVGCGSEDPRLPQRLYDEAIRLNQEGHNQEAQSLMRQLSTQYPETSA